MYVKSCVERNDRDRHKGASDGVRMKPKAKLDVKGKKDPNRLTKHETCPVHSKRAQPRLQLKKTGRSFAEFA